LTATPELNKTYLGKVQRITDFGAFVEIMAGTDGLLHVSEIANHRVKDVRDELKEGEQLLVKVINIDPTGKIRLSRKALLTEETVARLGRLRERYAAAEAWDVPALEALNKDFAESEGVGLGKIGPALRAVLSGGSPAPDLAGALVALGKHESLGRLDDALSLGG